MKKIRIVISALILVTTLLTSSVMMPAPTAIADSGCSKSLLGIPTWFAYLDMDANCQIIYPRKSDGSGSIDIKQLITPVAIAVIDILLRVAGIAAFFYIVLSGFKFVMAQGSPDKEKAARQSIINAAIGLVIAILAVGVVSGIKGFLLK